MRTAAAGHSAACHGATAASWGPACTSCHPSYPPTPCPAPTPAPHHDAPTPLLPPPHPSSLPHTPPPAPCGIPHPPQDIKREVDTAIEEVKAASVPPLELVWEHVYATPTAGVLRGVDALTAKPVVPNANPLMPHQ